MKEYNVNTFFEELGKSRCKSIKEYVESQQRGFQIDKQRYESNKEYMNINAEVFFARFKENIKNGIPYIIIRAAINSPFSKYVKESDFGNVWMQRRFEKLSKYIRAWFISRGFPCEYIEDGTALIVEMVFDHLESRVGDDKVVDPYFEPVE